MNSLRMALLSVALTMATSFAPVASAEPPGTQKSLGLRQVVWVILSTFEDDGTVRSPAACR